MEQDQCKSESTFAPSRYVNKAETLFYIGLAIAIFLLQGNNLNINLIRCQIFDGRVRRKLSMSAMDAYMYLAIVFI